MKITGKMLLIAIALGVLSAQSTEAPSVRQRARQERTQAPEVEVKTLKSKVKAKREEAQTVSIAPLQKSAEPLPQLNAPECSPRKHNGKVPARASR